jgi:two-component system alkaline phosphatase synthesis response regulator PhoP
MARILVVEDEVHLADGLRFNLEAEGHQVDIASDGVTAAERLTERREDFDLVLLDIMLPGMGGFEVLRRARAAGNLVAVLILTAKEAEEDIVRGLEEGADDYLTKPFRLNELLARVKGLIRRRQWDGVEDAANETREAHFGDVTVYFDRFEVHSPRGVASLTTREMGLLRALIASEGVALTRGELLESVWGLRPDTQTRVVDSFIVRLRRHVEADAAQPQHILSIRGHGYKFVR